MGGTFRRIDTLPVVSALLFSPVFQAVALRYAFQVSTVHYPFFFIFGAALPLFVLAVIRFFTHGIRSRLSQRSPLYILLAFLGAVGRIGEAYALSGSYISAGRCVAVSLLCAVEESVAGLLCDRFPRPSAPSLLPVWHRSCRARGGF